ncbi:hypothetical protein ACO0K3_03705 [Undibacterium sp. Rencai35W]|uniref:hypothetical protein n=1 Tax=Undibacterium sp. Rencai35W TaxID=3413046 RepID=UPI003BEF9566
MPNNAMPDQSEKRIKFDATVNLGHLLTFAGFLVTGAAMWQNMDKRVVVLEEARVSQQQIDRRQEESINENKRTVREDLKEISSKLDRLIERKP